jgi:tetrahydromethanopterin S-methyltransferase subunit E
MFSTLTVSFMVSMVTLLFGIGTWKIGNSESDLKSVYKTSFQIFNFKSFDALEIVSAVPSIIIPPD